MGYCINCQAQDVAVNGNGYCANCAVYFDAPYGSPERDKAHEQIMHVLHEQGYPGPAFCTVCEYAPCRCEK